MNVEKVNRYVIARGLHRLELGNTLWSAGSAIVDELGADLLTILHRLDCTVPILADAAMDARDAAQDTAWDPARDPAWDAAQDTAWDAAQDTPPR